MATEKKKNIHEGHRERLLSKILGNGFESVAQHEMLEAILFACNQRRDTNKIAHDLLDQFTSIYNVCGASEKELVKIKGVARKTARFLNLIPEIVKAYEHSFFEEGKEFDNLEEIGRYCVSIQMGNMDEVVYVLCLDTNHKLIKQRAIARGTPGSVYIETRKVIETVTHTSAVEVVLCHNHPGGTLFPSQKDFEVTSRVKEALKTIDVVLLDHIIVAKDKFVSFTSEHYIF